MGKKEEKKKAGGPSRYKPEYCEQVVEFMSEGLSFIAFCASIGHHSAVVYRWVDKYPEFKDAKLLAEEKSQLWWEKVSRAGTIGQIAGFNANSCRFNMSNRFPKSFKNKIEHSNDPENPVTWAALVAQSDDAE